MGSDPEMRPDYLVTIHKENPVQEDFKDAHFIPIEKAIAIALDDGVVSITKGGNIKIGKITIQRKGGDGGKPSACDLQIKFCPSDYHE